MESEEKDTQLEALKQRIPYDSEVFDSMPTYEQAMKDLLEDSKYIALSIRFPFQDFSGIELPKKYHNWQLRACVELYNLADKGSLLSYAENGLSWTRLTDGLSRTLISEIVPKVGVPRKWE